MGPAVVLGSNHQIALNATTKFYEFLEVLKKSQQYHKIRNA